jgi:hypothetical protein
MIEYSNNLVLGIVFSLAISFNAFFFTDNSLLILFFVSLLIFYMYSYNSNHKQNKQNKQNKHIKMDELKNLDAIIDLLQKKHEHQEYINSDLYIIFKKPKDFKYIKLNKLFIEDLIKLEFLETMDSFLYFELFIIIETFLKYYYNGIQRKNIGMCLNNMHTCYSKIKAYQNEVQITISKSKSFKEHEVIVKQSFLNMLSRMKNLSSIINEFLKF